MKPQAEAMVDALFRFGRRTFSASAMVLSWLEPHDASSSARMIGLDRAFCMDYLSRARAIDPFMCNLISGRRFGNLSAMTRDHESSRITDYSAFLKDHGFQDEIDFFFTHDGATVAVLALFAHQPFRTDPDSISSLYDFMSSFIACHPIARKRRRGLALRCQFALTPREIDAVELILEGASNVDISKRLGISLATTKTHVARALDKLGVRSRSELSALLNQF